MSGCKRPSRSRQPSITSRWSQVEGTSFDLTDFVIKEHTPTTSGNNKQSSIKSDWKSTETLNTTELISAVGQTWNLLNHFVVSEPRAKANYSSNGRQKDIVLADLGGEGVGRAPSQDDDNKYNFVDIKYTGHMTPIVQPKFEFLKVTQTMSMFKPCGGNYTYLLFRQFLKGGTNLSNESWKGKGLADLAISYEFQKIHGWMKELIPAGSHYPVNTTENKKTSEDCISGSAIQNAKGYISGDTVHPANNLVSISAECYSDSLQSKDVSACDNTEVATNIGTTSSLYSDYFLEAPLDTNVNYNISGATSSSLFVDYHTDLVAPQKSTHEKFQHKSNDYEVLEDSREEPQQVVIELENRMEVCSSASQRHQDVLAKQKHAYSGALAGIFVSLWLHPVDTIKTVIQSCRAEQKSIYDIGRSIVSNRGVSGLYRGIASNIASSAPISAIYTFTYESVKGSLLPFFPKEYHSFAHCIAGGCASIATSFVFTPSERIKQQMQIGSHYRNCWNALVGIIGKGGLPSLYAGWGAVLCRNVPHSIIKFYTYESLKQLMLSSQNSGTQPNTLQMLACGGLAGSTAALFSTPFDVVKTRLQTQIPGSMSQYYSVFHALQQIGKNEGLKGLYRGLIPRLVIYMSHGALFFTSYEFFKRFFSLEVPQGNAERIQYRESAEEDSKPLQLPS